jgi:hypothetical protein
MRSPRNPASGKRGWGKSPGLAISGDLGNAARDISKPNVSRRICDLEHVSLARGSHMHDLGGVGKSGIAVQALPLWHFPEPRRGRNSRDSFRLGREVNRATTLCAQ